MDRSTATMERPEARRVGQPLRVAIIGCGKIADAHAEEVAKISDAQVVAACDREALMAEQLAVRYGIPAFYDDVETMLQRERPDVVHITTPPQSHLPLAETCIRAGCHVYVEKPLTIDHESARALVDLARTSGKKLTVGYTTHYDPALRMLRQMVADGKLGDVVHVEAFLGYNLSGPFGAALMADPNHWVHRLPGKLFHNTIDHLVSKLLEFIEDEPEIISTGSAFEAASGKTLPFMNELRVIFKGKKTTAYLTFSTQIRPRGFFMRVYGSKATAHLDFVNRTLVVEPEAKLPGVLGRLEAPFLLTQRHLRAAMGNVRAFLKSDYQYFAGLNWLFTRFYRSIVEDDPLPISYAEILRVSAAMETIFDQLNQGGAGQ